MSKTLKSMSIILWLLRDYTEPISTCWNLSHLRQHTHTAVVKPLLRIYFQDPQDEQMKIQLTTAVWGKHSWFKRGLMWEWRIEIFLYLTLYSLSFHFNLTFELLSQTIFQLVKMTHQAMDCKYQISNIGALS